jgi:hypothetical protein
MLELILRACGFPAGLVLLTLFAQSVSRAALVTRHRGDRIAHGIGLFICSSLTRIAAWRRDYDAVQDVLAWVLPLYILALIVAWFALVQVGFSLILWSLRVESSPTAALIASGSALSTLGFLTPMSSLGQALAILEGAMGLGVVVFFFTFIPGYQAAIQARELKVAWLYARTGQGPTGFALVEWLLRSYSGSDMRGLWEQWEEWFRLLGDTLSVAPVLTSVPSARRGQAWLVSAAAVLDAACFYLATSDEDTQNSAAGVCRSTGVTVLRYLVGSHLREAAVAKADVWLAARDDFDARYDLLIALKSAVKAGRTESWERFVALRREYEGLLAHLRARLLVPSANTALCVLPQSPLATTGPTSTVSHEGAMARYP